MQEGAAHKLELALEKRASLFAEQADPTDVFRIVHSSADGFGGLTADKLGPIVLVERHLSEADSTGLIDALAARYGDNVPIFLKERWSKNRKERSGTLVRGPSHDGVVQVRELGLNYSLNACDDEHIGLFLDARSIRKRVREISKNKRVLNLFSYTGGFGMSAAAGGARSTTNVDNKRSALDRARINYALNELPFDSRTFLNSDAIKFIKRTATGKGRYDLVIVDPPPRFKQTGRNDFDAKTGYPRLLARCFGLLEQGGYLLAGLNALTVDDATYREMLEEAALLSGRHIRRLESLLPDKDFPKSADRPTARFSLIASNRSVSS